MAKIGINTRTTIPPKLPRLFFVLVDNKPHLNRHGLRYLSGWLGHVFIVTTNKKHPAFAMQKEVSNITVLLYPKQINFRHLFETLYETYKFKRVTIQSGGTMNTKLVREGIIDRISLVIAPLLVGGATTPTIMEGEAIHQVSQLALLKPLKLVSVKKLRDSYVHLVYKVLPKTVIK
jgi:2,5-diamino-6-(ribosylamino)-4(3H)-pyrimidinone 5'-phosphate reductase